MEVLYVVITGFGFLIRKIILAVFVTESIFYVVRDAGIICTFVLLTPWSRVLLEELTGSTDSQEIPRIFRTRRFLTVLTSARHLSLS